LISPDSKGCVQDQDAWLNIDLNSPVEKQEIRKQLSDFGIHYLLWMYTVKFFLG